MTTAGGTTFRRTPQLTGGSGSPPLSAVITPAVREGTHPIPHRQPPCVSLSAHRGDQVGSGARRRHQAGVQLVGLVAVPAGLGQ